MNLHLIVDELLKNKSNEIDNIEIIRINYVNGPTWEKKTDRKYVYCVDELLTEEDLDDLDVGIENPPF